MPSIAELRNLEKLSTAIVNGDVAGVKIALEDQNIHNLKNVNHVIFPITTQDNIKQGLGYVGIGAPVFFPQNPLALLYGIMQASNTLLGPTQPFQQTLEIEKGDSFLHLAAKYYHMPVRDHFPDNPSEPRLAILEALMQRGADKSLRNLNGRTPADCVSGTSFMAREQLKPASGKICSIS